MEVVPPAPPGLEVTLGPPPPQPSKLDSLLPVAVGQRTQLVALAILVVQVLGWFGVLPPERVNEATGALAPLALATLGAKVDRSTAAAAAPKVVAVEQVQP